MSPLVPCPSCARHVRSNEPCCPFCQSELPVGLGGRAVPSATRRLERLAAFTFAASLAMTACGGKEADPLGSGTGEIIGENDDDDDDDDGSAMPMYGMPAHPDDAGAAAPMYGMPAPPDEDAGAAAPMYGMPAHPLDGGAAAPMYGMPAHPLDGGAAAPMYGMPPK
ncbi:MAG: hypothetical protein KIT84_31595 [Labilithrix sp.]|nr:hypothetical protein [Labilithrix sp.]MCW5815614.1 hypothetical protein [Labilithrix sp.]